MLAAVHSAAVIGVDAHPVLVEVDVARGLPAWSIVGLASNAVKEARERVCAALVNADFEVPARRTTVNLSPADQVKTGTAFDLPIALAVLAASGQIEPSCVEGLCVAGELGLDGTIRPIRGALSMARLVAQRGYRALVLPEANGGEALLVGNAPLAGARTLGELVEQLRSGQLTAPAAPSVTLAAHDDGLDLSDVAGQDTAKRALEIAAAGAHNLLLEGPPGAGKTMLARRLPTILPPLTSDEHLEVVAIHSVGGILPAGTIPSRTPPFRAPHHTISQAGLIGGGVSSSRSRESTELPRMLQKSARIRHHLDAALARWDAAQELGPVPPRRAWRSDTPIRRPTRIPRRDRVPAARAADGPGLHGDPASCRASSDRPAPMADHRCRVRRSSADRRAEFRHD